MEFAVVQETIPVHTLAGVRQGDPLSSVVFNLAAEPLIRTAKASNDGFSLFGTKASVTAYADDIAIISSNTAELQDALGATDAIACDYYSPSPLMSTCMVQWTRGSWPFDTEEEERTCGREPGKPPKRSQDPCIRRRIQQNYRR